MLLSGDRKFDPHDWRVSRDRHRPRRQHLFMLGVSDGHYVRADVCREVVTTKSLRGPERATRSAFEALHSNGSQRGDATANGWNLDANNAWRKVEVQSMHTS